MSNEKKFPYTVAGLYKNTFTEKFVLVSMPIDKARADEICKEIQASVGGILEVREWGGISAKTGKKLPDYKVELLTAEALADRKAFGAAKKSEREAQQPQSDGLN